jgi:hypothetical protein
LLEKPTLTLNLIFFAVAIFTSVLTFILTLALTFFPTFTPILIIPKVLALALAEPISLPTPKIAAALSLATCILTVPQVQP